MEKRKISLNSWHRKFNNKHLPKGIEWQKQNYHWNFLRLNRPELAKIATMTNTKKVPIWRIWFSFSWSIMSELCVKLLCLFVALNFCSFSNIDGQPGTNPIINQIDTRTQKARCRISNIWKSGFQGQRLKSVNTEITFFVHWLPNTKIFCNYLFSLLKGWLPLRKKIAHSFIFIHNMWMINLQCLMVMYHSFKFPMMINLRDNCASSTHTQAQLLRETYFCCLVHFVNGQEQGTSLIC